jgi:hypothetical protein
LSNIQVNTVSKNCQSTSKVKVAPPLAYTFLYKDSTLEIKTFAINVTIQNFTNCCEYKIKLLCFSKDILFILLPHTFCVKAVPIKEIYSTIYKERMIQIWSDRTSTGAP